jgi:hypothetical protein
MKKSLFPNSTQEWVKLYKCDLEFCWLNLLIYRMLPKRNWEKRFNMGAYILEKYSLIIGPLSLHEAYWLLTFTNLFIYDE